MKNILLSEKYVLMQEPDPGKIICLTAFMKLELPNKGPNALQWVIGDIFLAHFYVEYDLDKHRVGFARKKPAPKTNG